MPKYSLVIPVWKHFEDCTKPCIESVIATTDLSNFEVIVVANGCGDDGTRQYVESLGSPFKLLWYDEAIGYTKATNAGIAASSGEYLILMNNDVILQSWQYKNEWLNMMTKPFEEDDKMAMTGPSKIFCEHTQEWFLVFFLVMIKRDLFNTVIGGKLNEVFNPGAGEDTECAILFRKAGYKIREVPEDREHWSYYTTFPVFHKAEATVFDIPEWQEIFDRNTEKLKELYPKRMPPLDIDTGLAELGSERNKAEITVRDFQSILQADHRNYNALNMDDILVLSAIIDKFKPDIIIETGTGNGFSTAFMAHAAKDAIIYTIDMPGKFGIDSRVMVNQQTCGNIFKDNPVFGNRIRQIEADTSEIKAANLPCADMWFIDADHSYDSVKHETLLAIENMRDGGVIVYHDANDELTYPSEVYKYISRQRPQARWIKTQRGVAYLTIPSPERPKGGLAAIMMTKDEVDIIPEVLARWSEFGIPIVVMDDSDDGTFEILRLNPNVHAFRQSKVYGRNTQGSGDWMFQAVLEKKREIYGHGNYVFLALGDEYWIHDPRKIAHGMKESSATHCRFHSNLHFLHVTDAHKWDFELNTWKPSFNLMSNRERLLHYSPDYVEERVFYDDGQCSYEEHQAFDPMPCCEPNCSCCKSNRRYWDKMPTIAHYPVRNPLQAIKRAKDRVDRSYQPSYSQIGNCPGESFLVYWGGKPTQKYEGRYPSQNGLDDLLPDEVSSNEEKPITASITDSRPKLSLITACTRPENLSQILRSIESSSLQVIFDTRWIIVVDGTKPNSIEVEAKDVISRSWVEVKVAADLKSQFGAAQRNAGLDAVTDGWVYFLDDDNLVHPHMASRVRCLIQEHPSVSVFAWQQQRDDRGPFVLGISEESFTTPEKIDTAQIFARREAIGSTRWEYFYQHDWRFAKALREANPDKIMFIQEPLCYWNRLSIGKQPKPVAKTQEPKAEELHGGYERAVFGKSDPILPREAARYKWASERIVGTKVLEIGCSSGFGLRFFGNIEGLEYLGIDHDQRIIDYARSQFGNIPGVQFECRDINTMDIGQWDTIIAMEVIEHLDNGRELAQKLKQHCKKLLITAPFKEPKGFWGPHHKLHDLKPRDFWGFDCRYMGEHGEIEHNPKVNPPDKSYAINLMVLEWPCTKQTVSASISTKGRYKDTLPLTLTAITHQTVKPDRVYVFQDGEHLDFRKDPLYVSVIAMLERVGISWYVIYAPGRGQVMNHQHMLETAETEWVWRIDDDEIPEPDCLEKLLAHAWDESVGAIGGLVLDPKGINAGKPLGPNRITDIFINDSAQWHTEHDVPVYTVEHLHSTFMYRVAAAKPYCHELSPVGHREETMFTYEIHRAGWKLILDTTAKTWHYRFPTGGIRSHTDGWVKDEAIFKRKMYEWEIIHSDIKLFVLDNGLGDHFCFRMILPELRKKWEGKKKIVLAVCYPEAFDGESGIEIISIAEAANMVGDIGAWSVYGWMWAHDWKKTIVDAYREMYLK